jgi:hypothetical protein
MLETIMTYLTLYTGLAGVAVLLGLGYFLSRRYEVSLYRFAGMILLIAILFSLGWVGAVKYGLNPYWVGGLYALILIGYAVKTYYHITWHDVTGKFHHPRPTA